MSSSKKAITGYRYFLGMHLVFSHGPVDKIMSILFDRKPAWRGEVTEGEIRISGAQNLFGGDEREGGVDGLFDFEQGADDQPVNAYLEAKLGDPPAYRGVTALVCKQAYLGNSPYLKRIAAIMQRIHVRQNGIEQWYDEKAAIPAYTVDPGEPVVGFNEPNGQSLILYAVGSPAAVIKSDTEIWFDEAGGGLTGVTGYLPADPSYDLPGDFRISFECNPDATFGNAASCFSRREAFYGTPTIFENLWGFSHLSGTMYFYAPALGVTVSGPLTTGEYKKYTAERINGVLSFYVDDVLTDSQPCSKAPLVGNQKLCVNGFYQNSSLPNIWNGPTAYRNFKIESLSAGFDADDMNPAHIIRECLTDPTWGMGYPEADIDDASFAAAADRLFDEQMGMSLQWDRQISIEDFVKEIQRHIDAALYVDRKTGKFVLKLIRDDYDAETLTLFDEDNIDRLENFVERRFEELVNCVTIKFNDSRNWKTASLEVQDIAQIHMQQAVVPATNEYIGFSNGIIAARVGARDLKALSTPLATCTIYTSAQAAREYQIGDVLKLSWAEHGVTELVMRVTALALGDGRNNTVKLDLAQDVFAMPEVAYVVTTPKEWTDPNPVPTPATIRQAFEAPYYEVVRAFGQGVVDTTLRVSPEGGYVGLAVGSPAGSAINAKLMTDAGAGYREVDTFEFAPTAQTVGSIGRMDTEVEIENVTDASKIVIDRHAQIGTELVAVTSIVGTTLTMRRAVLDTVPVDHPAGSRIIFWGSDYAGADETLYNDGETVNTKALTVAGSGVLSLGAAPVDTVVMSSRAIRPYPPADVKINGSYFPADAEGDIVVTWAHRDRRTLLGGFLLGFTEASTLPEAGTTYSLILRRADTNGVVGGITEITGNTATLSSAFSGEVILEIYSFRDRYASWQKHTIPLNYTSTAPETDFYSTEDDTLYETETGEFYEVTASPPPYANVYTLPFETAAPIRDGNRQVVFFEVRDDYPQPFKPPLPQKFTIEAQKVGDPASYFTAYYQLSSGEYGASVTHEQVTQRLLLNPRQPSYAGFGGEDIGFSDAAEEKGLDITVAQRFPFPGPADWCADFMSPESAGFDWAIIFPVGEIVTFIDARYPTSTSSPPGGWNVLVSTQPNYPVAPTVRIDAVPGSGFEDKLTVARSQMTMVNFNAAYVWGVPPEPNPDLGGYTYRVTLEGVDYDYTATAGETKVDVCTALGAMIAADPDYTIIANYGISITGLPGVPFTVTAEVL